MENNNILTLAFSLTFKVGAEKQVEGRLHGDFKKM